MDVQQALVCDIPYMIEVRVCLAFQTPVLQGKHILRVVWAQPSVSSPRRSVCLATKP